DCISGFFVPHNQLTKGVGARFSLVETLLPEERIVTNINGPDDYPFTLEGLRKLYHLHDAKLLVILQIENHTLPRNPWVKIRIWRHNRYPVFQDSRHKVNLPRHYTLGDNQ